MPRGVFIRWQQYVTGRGGGIAIGMAGPNLPGFRDLDAFLDELVRGLKQRGL
jgi:hypothetical protein